MENVNIMSYIRNRWYLNLGTTFFTDKQHINLIREDVASSPQSILTHSKHDKAPRKEIQTVSQASLPEPSVQTGG